MATKDFQFAWQASLSDGSTIQTAGSLETVKLAEYTTGTLIYRRVTLPAYADSSDVVKLWDYTQGDWSFFAFQIVGGEGYAIVAGQVDAFTAGAPAGTSARVQAFDVTCTHPLVLGPQAARVHVTLATATGVDGSGIPTILTNASTASGKWATLYAKNTSTTDAIEADLWIWG